MRLLIAAVLMISTLDVAADSQPFNMFPTSGPSDGGTEVVLHGMFLPGTYTVIFGTTPALSTTRVDSQTLRAVTPPHLPGIAEVAIWSEERGGAYYLKYEFTGPVPAAAFERMLMPVFQSEVRGAYGSKFRTELRLSRKGDRIATTFGLNYSCPSLCPGPIHFDSPIEPIPDGVIYFVFNGTPGRFFYVPRTDVDSLAAHLRVHDVSRNELDFGTEIPIVRERDFVDRITLIGVPTDPRFRNTLRIYGVDAQSARVTVQGRPAVIVPLRAGANIFDPAYAVFTDFPIGDAPVRVTIEGDAVYAFLTVTNNETQAMATITP